MQKKITFRENAQRTQALEDQINKELLKIERLMKREPTPAYIDVVVEAHDVHAYNRVAVQVKTPNFDCYTEAKSDDLHATINEAIEKMYRQLLDDKETLVSNNKKGCGKACKAAWARKWSDEQK